ncbi:conserved hypothetical protein [uncultured Defluviicoccus sp.]|nr:conserved hypothetical protein [uncultured Defluviicoccus sp.]
MATTKETAMSEVRPWLGSYISVGQFKILRDVLLVNCCAPYNYDRIGLFFEEPLPEEREKVVWAHIDEAFSQPVSQGESTADYAPTQIMAEYFRAHGYDGIVYKSSLGSGLNVSLFDTGAAGLLNCWLYKVQKVSFDFVQTETPYFIDKHYETKND